FEGIRISARPATVQAAPPARNQTELLLGDPRNTWDTLDSTDSCAFHPFTSRTIPPARSAMPINLFMFVSPGLVRRKTFRIFLLKVTFQLATANPSENFRSSVTVVPAAPAVQASRKQDSSTLSGPCRYGSPRSRRLPPACLEPQFPRLHLQR